MSTEPIRCLEFFSGIGGLHYALNIAQIHAVVVQAFDVNLVANKVYQHNFGLSPSTRSIDRLTLNELESYKANCWLLSPPCQPYTRGGNQKDIYDPRAKPLLHLIDLLPQLSHSPDYIFLENVKDFELSKSREKLIQQLVRLNYTVQECLLSPTQFGIPNTRLRYYLMARKKRVGDKIQGSICLDLNHIYTSWPFTGQMDVALPELSFYLEKDADENKDYRVPDKSILKLHKFRLDIVQPTDRLTSCITKAYGSRHIRTSGSLIQTRHMECRDYNWDDTLSLLKFGLRFLTPLEVARLHAFPSDSNKFPAVNNDVYVPPDCKPHLDFPDGMSLMEQYRLLGNSLNCWVVAQLYRHHLFC
ncbi:S-adenosyl-L-methionine-dependent methyltransferase [Pilobolus umbonatus]|nr:S-adenosyl-L-methionine-dependent methyltransferase [Pilobolus umbonatus]